MYHGTTISLYWHFKNYNTVHRASEATAAGTKQTHEQRERQGKHLRVRIKGGGGGFSMVLVGPDPPEPHPHPQLLSFHLLSLTHTSHIIKTFAAELIERQIKNKLRKMRWRMPARTS